jgi:hypothetical protein
LEKSSFASLFETAFNLQNQELLSCEVVPEKCKIIPSFILYSEKLTEEGRD